MASAAGANVSQQTPISSPGATGFQQNLQQFQQPLQQPFQPNQQTSPQQSNDAGQRSYKNAATAQAMQLSPSILSSLDELSLKYPEDSLAIDQIWQSKTITKVLHGNALMDTFLEKGLVVFDALHGFQDVYSLVRNERKCVRDCMKKAKLTIFMNCADSNKPKLFFVNPIFNDQTLDLSRVLLYTDPKLGALEVANPNTASRLVLVEKALKGDHIFPAHIEGITVVIDTAQRHSSAQGLSMQSILSKKDEARMGTIYFDKSVSQPERVKLALSLLNIEIGAKNYRIDATFVGGQLRFCAPLELTNDFVLMFEMALQNVCSGCTGVAPDTFKVQRPRPEKNGKKERTSTAVWLKQRDQKIPKPKVFLRYNGEKLDNNAHVLMFLNAVNGNFFDETIVNQALRYLEGRGAIEVKFDGNAMCFVAPYPLARELHDRSLYKEIGFQFKCPFVEGETAPSKQKEAEERRKKVAVVLEEQRQKLAVEEAARKHQEEEDRRIAEMARQIYKPPVPSETMREEVSLEEVPEILNLLSPNLNELKNVPTSVIGPKVVELQQVFLGFPEETWTNDTAVMATGRLKDICSIAYATGCPVTTTFVTSIGAQLLKLKGKPISPEKKADIELWLQILQKVWDRAKVSPTNPGQPSV